MDEITLRAEFPVLRRLAYLNAGTDGPLPARAVSAAKEELCREAEQGRTRAHSERCGELEGELRAAYATVLGCDTADLALTNSTSEGIAQVVGGLELGRGDQIVTSDEEHPGLLGALSAACGEKYKASHLAPPSARRRLSSRWIFPSIAKLK